MASLLGGSGCVAHAHTTGHPDPVPTTRHPAPVVVHPASHHVDAREAEHIALEVAAQRGYRDSYVRELKWKDNEFRWDVKTEGYVARRKSRLDMWIDAETGEILRLKDHADSGKHSDRGHHGAYPPPAHPPHGHRHTHAGVQLVFDSGLGVYLVVDRHDHFYTEGRFYRYADDGWQVSTQLKGDWHQVARPGLPPGLAKKHTPGPGHAKNDPSGKGHAKNDPSGKGHAKNDRPGKGHAKNDKSGKGHAKNDKSGKGHPSENRQHAAKPAH
jgi:hypothetical protein